MNRVDNESRIKTTDVITMSAKYRYDGETPKLDYMPERFDYPDGWSFFHHAVLSDAKDEAFGNGSYFQLFNNVMVRDMRYVKNISTDDMVIWAALKAHNGKYLKSKTDRYGTRIFAVTTAESVDDLTYDNIFRITKSDDGYFMISQGSKFMTVLADAHNRFEIRLEDEIESDPHGVQHFGVERTKLNDGVMFYSQIKNIWDSKKWRQSRVIRYFSIFDNFNHTSSIEPRTPMCFPHLYKQNIENLNDSDYCDMLMCNGNVHYDKYQNVAGLSTAGNYCVFQIADSLGNAGILPLGYDGKIRWVSYYNNFTGSFFNKDTTTRFVFDEVKPSVLYEVPYEYGTSDSFQSSSVAPSGWVPNGDTLNDSSRYAFDHQKTAAIENSPIELKSIMTSEYTYTDAGKEMKDGR